MASFLQRAFMGLTGDVKGAFRASKSNQSDTYYKPTPVETKLIDSLAKFSKDMVKSAGMDPRSVQPQQPVVRPKTQDNQR